MALAQLLIAFVVFALWRGRRLGRPVAEVQPVEIAGSELVVAVGNLLQKAGRPEIAAERLRSDLPPRPHGPPRPAGRPRHLTSSPTSPLSAPASTAMRWHEHSRDRSPPHPTALVTAARDVEEVRTAVLGSRA